jgi:cytoskeletal protein RodZ
MSVSIGAALRQAREARRLTLAQVSEVTKVRPPYLEALENDDLSAMPSTAQARGFLRIYTQFLGIDLDALISAPKPEPEPAPSSADGIVAEVESQVPAPRPGLLAKLRERLAGRDEAEAPSSPEPAAEPSQPREAHTTPEPENKKKSLQITLAEALETTPVEPPAEPSVAVPPVEQAPSEPLPQSAVIPDLQPPEAESAEVAESRSRFRSIFSRIRSALRRPADEALETSAGDDEAARPAPDGTVSTAAIPFANARDFNPLPPEDEASPLSSDEIFAEIGRQLRARREMLSLTYEELERHTRVRASFLEGLEQGAIEDLPSPVHTRGILANYAAFIDLDVDAILLRFADGVQARHREQRPSWPSRTRAPMTVRRSLPPFRSFIASDLLFGGGAAIMLILFAFWGINRVMSVRASSPPQATAPSISDALAGTLPPTVVSEITFIPAEDTTPVPATAAAEDIPLTPVDPSITVQVKLSATERTYMRISVDDGVQFEGRAEPGKDYYYQATREINVLVGNAAAVTVTYNGRDLGLLGNYGEVADRLFTARGVLTPTATLPPTRTPSATPTRTPAPTPTLATYTPTLKVER